MMMKTQIYGHFVSPIIAAGIVAISADRFSLSRNSFHPRRRGDYDAMRRAHGPPRPPIHTRVTALRPPQAGFAQVTLATNGSAREYR